MKSTQKITQSSWWWLVLLVILVVINFGASLYHTRLDLTREKRYTLSKATRDLVHSLDDKLEIEVFLKGEFPSGFRKLANSTQEFLELLKDRNSSRINYSFISPRETIEGTGLLYGDSLARMGATPINLTAQREMGQSTNIIFPVAVMKYKGRQSLVNLYTGATSRISQEEINNAEALMEYQFANALNKLVQTEKPGIAYSIGNGEPTDQRTYDIRASLSQDYKFGIIDINKQAFIPPSVNLLLIVKPTLQFSEDEKFKIDQFVMHGGKLLCFIDNLIAEQDSLFFAKGETIAFDRNLNLTDLFFRYGLRINTDLIMDLQCDMLPFLVNGDPNNPQLEYMHWNYFPFLVPTEKSIGDIGYIGGRFVNSIDTIATPGISKKILLASSSSSRIISTPARISLNENRDAPQDKLFNRNAIPAAVLLDGKFASLYRNRASQAQRDSMKAQGMEFLSEAAAPNKIVVAGDGDMVLNEFIPATDNQPELPLPMGWNKYTYKAYLDQSEGGRYFMQVANHQFFLNTVELMLNNADISATRNKEIVLRLLDAQKVKSGKTMWQFINIALPILFVILAALLFQWLRANAYAKRV